MSTSSASPSHIASCQQGATLPGCLMSQARIMMVDDEPLNMEVLQVHLEAEGYQNFTLINRSTQAIENLREHMPDVLLLDLNMPEMCGFEILKIIRTDIDLKHVPVIVLTSSDDSATKLQALRLGATDFLSKPVDASELALRMRNTLAARAYQERMVHLDSLTGLPNRLYFTSLLQNAITAVAESDRQARLVLVNINRFKLINDSLGPDAGDELLRRFAERLRTAFGLSGMAGTLASSHDPLQSTMARLSGDGFAVLLIDSPSTGELQSLDARMTEALSVLEHPCPIDGQDVHLSVRMGISALSPDNARVDLLINQAETAMLHSTRLQSAAFAYYSAQMDADVHTTLSIENGMRKAVEKGEIFLVYQPKVCVASGNITGAEALVRWMHPDYGLISPVNFIPLAESTGMIVSIGEWVLRESCRQTAEWRAQGYPTFCIAVNVSIRQLYELDFLATVQRALDDSGLPAEALILELTETMVMEDAETNLLKLKQLKALGLRVSIDDFGTGYSSLAYLHRFPCDQLKIDRAFIKDVKTAHDRLPIVLAVTRMAHDLGLSVVAEGVETPLQLAHVKALGCEEYQGYLCSKPCSADTFAQLLIDDRQDAA